MGQAALAPPTLSCSLPLLTTACQFSRLALPTYLSSCFLLSFPSPTAVQVCDVSLLQPPQMWTGLFYARFTVLFLVDAYQDILHLSLLWFSLPPLICIPPLLFLYQLNTNYRSYPGFFLFIHTHSKYYWIATSGLL